LGIPFWSTGRYAVLSFSARMRFLCSSGLSLCTCGWATEFKSDIPSSFDTLCFPLLGSDMIQAQRPHLVQIQIGYYVQLVCKCNVSSESYAAKMAILDSLSDSKSGISAHVS
jgi:hypothetical protein